MLLLRQVLYFFIHPRLLSFTLIYDSTTYKVNEQKLWPYVRHVPWKKEDDDYQIQVLLLEKLIEKQDGKTTEVE